MSDPNINPYFDPQPNTAAIEGAPMIDPAPSSVAVDSGMKGWMPTAAFFAGVAIFALVVAGGFRHSDEAPSSPQQHAANTPQAQTQPAQPPSKSPPETSGTNPKQ